MSKNELNNVEVIVELIESVVIKLQKSIDANTMQIEKMSIDDKVEKVLMLLNSLATKPSLRTFSRIKKTLPDFKLKINEVKTALHEITDFEAFKKEVQNIILNYKEILNYLNEIRSEVEVVKSEFDDQKNIKITTESDLKTLNIEQNQNEKSIKQISKKIQQHEKEYERNQVRNANLVSSNKMLEKSIATNKKKNDTFVKEHASSKSNLEKSRFDLSNINEEIKSNKIEIKKNEKELENQVRQKAKMDSEIYRNFNKISKKSKELEALSKKAHDNDDFVEIGILLKINMFNLRYTSFVFLILGPMLTLCYVINDFFLGPGMTDGNFNLLIPLGALLVASVIILNVFSILWWSKDGFKLKSWLTINLSSLLGLIIFCSFWTKSDSTSTDSITVFQAMFSWIEHFWIDEDYELFAHVDIELLVSLWIWSLGIVMLFQATFRESKYKNGQYDKVPKYKRIYNKLRKKRHKIIKKN